MNCKAEEVQSRAALRSAYRQMGEIFLSFLDMSAGCVLHDHAGLGKKRLQQLFDITNNVLNTQMKHLAADGEKEEETVLTIIWKMKQELKICGFDFDAETAALEFKDPFHNTWHNASQRNQHEHRVNFVHRMHPTVAVYYLSILDYMHNEIGYGKERLHNLYVALREDYNLFLTAYLACKPKSDAEAEKMIEERQKRVEAFGLNVIEF